MKQPSNTQRHQSGITSVTTNRTKPHTAATRLYTFILFSFIALIAAFPLRLSAQDAHITVDGKPMLILGGELSNSAATCTDDIDRVMPEMKTARPEHRTRARAMGLNRTGGRQV